MKKKGLKRKKRYSARTLRSMEVVEEQLKLHGPQTDEQMAVLFHKIIPNCCDSLHRVARINLRMEGKVRNTGKTLPGLRPGYVRTVWGLGYDHKFMALQPCSECGRRGRALAHDGCQEATL